MDSMRKSQLDTFVWETREHLEHLEPDVLCLQRDPSNAELINRIFRGVHSVKGGAGFFGFDSIQDLSHGLEGVMTQVRDGEMAVDQILLDLLLAGLDKLRLMIDDPEHSDQVNIVDEMSVIEQLLHGDESHSESTPSLDAMAYCIDLSVFSFTMEQVDDVVKKGLFVYRAEFYTSDSPGDSSTGCLARVESVGQVIDAVTHVRTSPEDDQPECVVLFASVLQEDMIDIALEIEPKYYQRVALDALRACLLGRGSEEESPAKQDAPRQTAVVLNAGRQSTLSGHDAETSAKVEESVRLPISLLDELMDLAGELVLGRNQLLMLADDIKEDINGFVPALRNIDRVATGLRDKVMSTRLQPLGNLFVKFQRTMRDLAAELGKQIDLEISGTDVELDKSLIEILSDPLTHIMRNCADHGIESPQEREACGKSLSGHVKLSASHQAGRVFIRISDDGRGIDHERVKRKAIERGLVRIEDADGMSVRQILKHIFTPGFSTAEDVSNISGRGVGMDVVKSNIEKVGGSIDIDSQLGKGTSIILCLPLTVAVVPAMVVRVRDRLFAVPQVQLEELVKLKGDVALETVRGARVLRLRERLLPVVDMAELLELDEVDARSESTYVLVMKSNQDRFCLLVDELLDEEEIVVKPLNEHVQMCPCYSGATILGDGRIVLILDTAGIVNHAGLEFMDEDNEYRARQEQEQRRRVTETQHLLLFRNAQNDLFAINQELISRIEKIRKDQIETIACKEFVTYKDEALQLIRLEDYLPVKAPEEEPESWYVLVPKLVKNPMGILCAIVEDAVDVNVELDALSIKGPGIMGSAMLAEGLTIFVDIYSLFEAVDPETYCGQSNGGGLRGVRILLAEDTLFFRALVSQYLESLECVVDVAQDGVEAWEMLNRKTYDLLLTDLEMPGMDGFELTANVRASSRLNAMPIVALSSISKSRYLDRAVKAGVDAYESKIDKDQLRVTLAKLLDTPAGSLPAKELDSGDRQMLDLDPFSMDVLSEERR